METIPSMVLDIEWLEDNFPTVGIYARNVVRNTMGTPVYGTHVPISQETGIPVELDIVMKREIHLLFEQISVYCEREGMSKPILGYFQVVVRDYKSYHNEYIPYTA